MSGRAGPDDRLVLSAPRGSTVRMALLVVGSTGTVLALLMSLGLVLVARQADQEKALRRADRLAVALANDVVGPALDLSDPQRTQALDQLLGSRARDGSIVRIKVWTPEGVVVWADDHRLIGRRYDLEPVDQALLGTRDSYAEPAALDRPENEFEIGLPGSFIEVYAGFFDRAGRPLLFEAYQPVDELGGLQTGLLGPPLVLLGPLLAVVLSFALSLARRVDRALEVQERLLRHAVEASEVERRRLARDLHDGVIQDLAGVGYVFSALEAQLADRPAAQATVRTTGEIVQRDVLALRTLITDLYPPDLGGEGLEPALEELLAHCEQSGLATVLDVSDSLDLTPTTALLAYRVVREALRNVGKHARATKVLVEVHPEDGWLRVRVSDDGRGFEPAAPAPEGHLGLRVLRDTVSDAGGHLDVSSTPRGTVLEASMPAG